MAESGTEPLRFPSWDVQPWSGSKWSRLLVAPVAVIVVLIIAVHSRAILIGALLAIVVIALIAVVVFAITLRVDRRSLRGVPSGALFAGGGHIWPARSVIRDKFQSLSGKRGIPVNVVVSKTTFTLAPKRNSASTPFVIPFTEILALKSHRQPSNALIGSLDIDTSDGSKLHLSIQNYRKLAPVLQAIQRGPEEHGVS